MGVFLGGRETGVAEKFLDGTEVGAIGEKMRGVGVAQAVGMKRGIAAENSRVQLDDAASAAIGEARASVVDQQGSLGGFGGALGKIIFERGSGFRSVGDLPLLFSFAADANPALLEIEIVEIQADQFGDAQAAAVEQLEQEQVALGMRAVQLILSDAVDQRVGLFGSGNQGDALGSFGGSHQARGVGANGAFAEHEGE